MTTPTILVNTSLDVIDGSAAEGWKIRFQLSNTVAVSGASGTIVAGDFEDVIVDADGDQQVTLFRNKSVDDGNYYIVSLLKPKTKRWIKAGFVEFEDVAGPVNLQDVIVTQDPGTLTAAQAAVVTANAAADRAEAAAASVSLEVANYVALDALTGGIEVGESVRVKDIGQLYTRVSSGGDITTTGGLSFDVVPQGGYRLTPQQFGCAGDFNFSTGTGTDDTAGLQAMFTRAMQDKLLVDLGTGYYLYSDLIATVDVGIDVVGHGWHTALVKADSYTGAAFEFDETFGPLSQYYPNSAKYEHVADHDSATGGNIWSNFCIVGRSRATEGHGIDFKDRNDLIRLVDMKFFNLRGSAWRFTGDKGNLREGIFERPVVRLCGSDEYPAVDFRQPTFENTGCTANGTTVTLTGTGDDFTSLTGSPPTVRIAGARSDGGVLEVRIASIDSATQVTLEDAVETNVTNAPLVFYADVDGQNHIVVTDGQVVGCYGTFVRLSHERDNAARRLHFDGLMLHGQTSLADGVAGDLLLIEGDIDSVVFDRLRINAIEVDPTTAEKFAGVRVKGGRVLPLYPDRVEFNDIDILNLENVGEGYIVVEKVGHMRVRGSVACSSHSGVELKVLTDAIQMGLEYDVMTSTSLTVRDNGAVDAFDIAADQVDKVHMMLDKIPEIPPSFRTIRLLQPASPNLPAAKILHTNDVDPSTLSDQSAYQLAVNPSNSVRSPALWWHSNSAANDNWLAVQMTGTATANNMRDVGDNANTHTPVIGWKLYCTSFGQALIKSGSDDHSLWYKEDGQVAIIPGVRIGGATLGTWVASGSGADEYYLDTGGALTDVSQVIEGDRMWLSQGTAGSLAVGEFDVADNDSIGYSTIYVRTFNTGTAPSAMGSYDIRYRTTTHGAETKVGRSISWGGSAPTSGYYFNGDIVYDITPQSGQPMGWMCSAKGYPGTWVTMASNA